MTWSPLKGFTKDMNNDYHVDSFAREAKISFPDCFTIAQKQNVIDDKIRSSSLLSRQS